MLPFAGPAVPLSPGDIDATAARMGILRASVVAVLTVETGGAGGYLSDGSGRPRILCEAKRFGDGTGHRWDATYPNISSRVNNYKLYAGGAAEYDRLAQMVNLNRPVGLESASWGLFQVMGSNWKLLGFESIEAFVTAMAASEAAQLAVFATFCERNYLVQPLRDRDWPRFSRGYNGENYALNHYDTRLQSAFLLADGNPPPDGVLHIGCKGPDVQALQRTLVTAGYPMIADGVYGRVTELAVRTFQSMRGMTADGIAGPATSAALKGAAA
ncbi:MAG TPA: N-acetylmuramidase domain-containing protein [Acetobacteraceae bacterium]